MKLFSKVVLSLGDDLLGKEVKSMTKYVIRFPDWTWLGSLAGGAIALHYFHQGEPQRNCFHSHEFDFWTFPLASYQEAVLDPQTGKVSTNIVRAFRLHRRNSTILHQVVGKWYDANYGMGVANKYESFWTIGISKKQVRNFDLATFEHPEGWSYEEFCKNKPRANPKPFWQLCVIYFKENVSVEIGKLFPKASGPAVQAEAYPYDESEFDE